MVHYGYLKIALKPQMFSTVVLDAPLNQEPRISSGSIPEGWSLDLTPEVLIFGVLVVAFRV